MSRGFIDIFSRRAPGFHRQAKLFEPSFFINLKNFPVDGQTRWAKLPPQLVNLPGVWPLKINNLKLLCIIILFKVLTFHNVKKYGIIIQLCATSYVGIRMIPVQ